MEYDLVNRGHQHPLLFEVEGNFNGVCSRCRLPLFAERFSCYDCNFHIHQSCIHLPPRIHSPFHPQHPLLKGSSDFPYCCHICGQRPSLDEVYSCNECRFQMDIKCAIADTKSSVLFQTDSGKYRHFSHPHPLTLTVLILQQQQDIAGIQQPVCVLCDLLIESGSSTYSCSQCDDTHFHKQCAELPRELQNDHSHHHPLFFLRVIKNHHRDDKTICNSCRNCCIGFGYSCPPCKFFLHVTCLQSFKHKHVFTMLRTDINFTCGICGRESKDRFPWFCKTCHMLVHKKCIEFPLTLRAPEHSHDLTFHYFSPDVKNILCKICGNQIKTQYAAYRCSECNYSTHLNCAQAPCADPHAALDWQTDSTENDKDEKNKIPHFCHPGHDLTLFPPEKSREKYRVCDGCMKCLSDSDPSYGCHHCEFFLHEECAKLPTTKSHRFHPHLLTLISIPNFVFQCEACLQHFHGFAYHCKTCLSTFDVRCASIQIPLKHPNHQHPLFLCDIDQSIYSGREACEACGKFVTSKRGLQCSDTNCNFYLDLGCATLPVIVRYRFDPHPLNLTFVEEEGLEEYYCDICEEERELGLWFYSCGKCSFAAHPRCAIGEFPYVKSTMHKSHRHPLNLVLMKDGKEEGWDCGACNDKSCAHNNLAFECGACKFNVHATGRCYDLQVLEGNLAFTNHNIFSRANQPYDCEQLIQNLPIGVTLGPFGGTIIGDPWKVRFFSTIRAFVVCHDENGIHYIKIQYPLKSEKLVWSENDGEEEGTKTEVPFDYPVEYLIAIHGSLDDFTRSISSLTLQTNRKTYGPFGVETNAKFSSKKEGVRIIGIFGSNRYSTNSIGFYGVSTRE